MTITPEGQPLADKSSLLPAPYDYVPLGQLAVIHLPEADFVEVVIQAYCDGSGKPDDPGSRYLTLSGLIGPPDAWADFERGWAAVREEHDAPPWHSKDAHARVKDFDGWTPQQVINLKMDLLNVISSIAWTKEIWHASCTIDLDAYRQLQREGVEFPQSPTYLCAVWIARAALRQLPDNPDSPIKKDGRAQLFFDPGDGFLNVITKEWERRKGDWQGDIVSRIIAATIPSYRDVAEIQAADLMAWSVNRSYTTGDSLSGYVSTLAAPAYHTLWDYEHLSRVYGSGA